MASPTEGQVQTQWQNGIAMIMKLWQAGRTDALTNIIARLDTLVQSANSDFAPNIVGMGQTIRNSLANIVGMHASVLMPHIQSYNKHVYNYPNLSDINEMIDNLFTRWHAGTVRIPSRQFTFGTPAAGGANVGNGQVLRLNKDKYNYDMENQHADSKRFTCLRDVNLGTAKWEEAFELRGYDAGIDELDMIGSGLVKEVAAFSARDSLLLNPSFSSYSGALPSTPTDITNWVCSPAVGAANYEIDETNYFRDFLGDTTPRS
jgi:hypothetical protein